MPQSVTAQLTSHVEKMLRQDNTWRRNVNVVAVISDKYTTFEPLGKILPENS